MIDDDEGPNVISVGSIIVSTSLPKPSKPSELEPNVTTFPSLNNTLVHSGPREIEEGYACLLSTDRFDSDWMRLGMATARGKADNLFLSVGLAILPVPSPPSRRGSRPTTSLTCDPRPRAPRLALPQV